MRAYSKSAFGRLLAMPGVVVSVARHEGEAVGAHLFVVDGEVAFAHLAALDPVSHEVGAAYALYFAGLEHFRGRVRWIHWGGEAGISSGRGGLASLKRGWSTGTRPAYFCGRIFDAERYAEIARARGALSSSHFPAYRCGEFR